MKIMDPKKFKAHVDQGLERVTHNVAVSTNNLIHKGIYSDSNSILKHIDHDIRGEKEECNSEISEQYQALYNRHLMLDNRHKQLVHKTKSRLLSDNTKKRLGDLNLFFMKATVVAVFAISIGMIFKVYQLYPNLNPIQGVQANEIVIQDTSDLTCKN